jgi:predicted XRE-type DNA-binding protein
MVYLARVKGTIYVLHCFTKNTGKTERRDLATAENRWRQVQQRLQEDGSVKSKTSEVQTPYVTKGSVLDDLGFTSDEALEIRVKADLYRDLLRHINERGLTQRQLASLLDVHQPDVSNLLNGRISKFSVGKLIKFAGRLNLGAEIKIIELPGVKEAVRPAKKTKMRKTARDRMVA